ncbi:MAG: diacylglycerol/lipid kinase family protein [Planctomycetota bacterium]|jgi:diacylglycerol kinase (ATP)
MRAKIILNPWARSGRAEKHMAEVGPALVSAGIDYELVALRRRGQAHDEALSAAYDRYDVVIAAGGDGTINEVVSGLIDASGNNPTCPLGILPLGTANDFSDSANIPRDLRAAAKLIASGNCRQIDAGRVRHAISSRAPKKNGQFHNHYFDNSCAVAMEPMVVLNTSQSTRVPGNIRYLYAVIKSMLNMKAWRMQISWDTGAYEGPISLLSVANGPRTGGVFNVAPQARLDDGLFDLVFAPEMPLRQVLSIVPRLIMGSHLNHPKIFSSRTSSLHIRSEPGTPIHADGELIAEGATTINYQILPGKITLLAPE